MTNDIEIQPLTDQEEDVVALLNEAYNGWGNEDLFTWKYDEYPDYEPKEHTFSISIDGELAAFRRVFYKELTSGSNTIPVYALGDTAVSGDYQGQGLYSKLHSHTMEYSSESDCKKAITYNRKGNITYNANLDRGWEYRALPLQLRILSPKPVLKTYASLVVDEIPAITSIADLIGDRLHIQTTDGRLTLSELVRKDTKPACQSIGPGLSDTGVMRYVETVNSDGTGIVDILRESIKLIAGGHITVRSPSSRSSKSSIEASQQDGMEIDLVKDIIPAKIDLDEIVQLYDQDVTSFRRTREDIEHIVGYPGADLLVARREGNLIGYAVLGPRENDGVVEGRILESQSVDDNTLLSLIGAAEQRAINRGFDLILVFSERDFGDKWATIDRQVIMWDELEQTDTQPLKDTNLQISLYDVA
ncbi:GNAT family N-acetyltransferase [Natronorubrum bangense]|uniref:N-acetyltransferase domain-containing protein n=1 Tax=Natronorubrum bangense JCM 10635 TaxID=1227500 RepID=L9VZP9_9EURY|nr:GNAT family N-acetyltransferase [Natronorubrum bangense]ELY42685.1 hypothetical protein C494_20323 [Natronorubrum bangense JCM 10635]